MKLLLKILGVLVTVVVIAVLGGLGYLMLAFPKVPPPAVVTLEPTPERLARVRAANITPDADTGIGSWTEQQFVDKFKGFETPSDAVLSDTERRQNTVMPMTAYAGMTREDLAAIYTYLRTLPPVVNRVTRFPDAK